MTRTPSATHNKSGQHKNVLIVWLAIFPLITGLLYAFESYLALLPLVGRTFVLTIIAVPLTSYVMLPLYNRLFHKWLTNNQPTSNSNNK